MNIFLVISKAIDWFNTKLGQGMWWLGLLMVIIGAENVIARYAFEPIANTFGENVARALSNNTYLELQTYMYNLIFLLGAAYVLKADGHVRVDILFSRLSNKAKAWVDSLGTIFFLIPFCLLGIYFSQSYVARSWRSLEVSPNPGGLPRYPIKTVIIVAFVLLILQGLSELIKNIAFLSGHPNSRSIHAKIESETS